MFAQTGNSLTTQSLVGDPSTQENSKTGMFLLFCTIKYVLHFAYELLNSVQMCQEHTLVFVPKPVIPSQSLVHSLVQIPNH